MKDGNGSRRRWVCDLKDIVESEDEKNSLKYSLIKNVLTSTYTHTQTHTWVPDHGKGYVLKLSVIACDILIFQSCCARCIFINSSNGVCIWISGWGSEAGLTLKEQRAGSQRRKMFGTRVLMQNRVPAFVWTFDVWGTRGSRFPECFHPSRWGRQNVKHRRMTTTVVEVHAVTRERENQHNYFKALSALMISSSDKDVAQGCTGTRGLWKYSCMSDGISWR